MSKSELFEAMRQEQPGGLANAASVATKDAQAARAPLSALLDSAATAELRLSWKGVPTAAPPVKEPPAPPPKSRREQSALHDTAASHGRAHHVVVDDDDGDGDDDGPPPNAVVPYIPPVLPTLPALMSDPSARLKPVEAMRYGPTSDRALDSKRPGGLARPAAVVTAAQGRPAPLAARLDNATGAKRALAWKDLPSAQRAANGRTALSRSGQATQTATRGAVQAKSHARSSGDGDGKPPPKALDARASSSASALPPSRPSGAAQRVVPRSQGANVAPGAAGQRTAALGATTAGLHGADQGAAHDPLARIDTLPLPDDDATALAFNAADLANYLVALNPETYAALQRTCAGALRSVAQFAIDSCGGAGRVNAVALRRMLKNGVLRVDAQGRPTVALPPGGVATALAARSLAAALKRSCGVTAAGCPQPGCALGTLDLPAAVMAEANGSTPV